MTYSVRSRLIKSAARLQGFRLARGLLARTPYWTEEQRHRYTTQQLGRVLVAAAEGSPYYTRLFRQAGFDPRTDFRDATDICGLPLLDRSTIRDAHDELLDSRHLRWSIRAETSGTTGEPLQMRLSTSFVAFDSACIFRHWMWGGYGWRDRVAALRSYVPTEPGAPLWRFDWPQNTLFMSAYHLTPANASQYLDQMLRFRPVLLKAYPSSAAVLAEYAFPQRERFDFLKAIYVSSETLTPSERASIERTFGRRLFNWYGMTEPAIVITECEAHEGMHVNWEYGFCEFVPGDDLPPNEFHLVTTGYHNPVMPFVRYDTGDVVRIGKQRRCSCGRNMPLVETVVGRKDECIVTPEGRRLPSVNFYTVFRQFTEILKFQIVQYGRSEVSVKVAFRPTAANVPGVVQRLRREMSARLGGSVSLEVEATDRFITNRDGKTPPILRRAGTRSVEEQEEYTVSSQAAWAAHRAGRSVLKLDWNEADRLPSARVRARVRALLEEDASYCWYPEALSEELERRLSAYVSVPPKNVLAVHGSDLGIELLATAVVRPGDRVLIVTPTYDNFRAVTEQRGADVRRFTYLGAERFPLDAFLGTMREAPPRVVYLTNPNNPIGYVFPRDVLLAFIDACAALGTVLVVDEAYAEFSSVSIVDQSVRDVPLVVLRTFSKAFGLAGIRLGYLIAADEPMRVMRRIANPKNVTMFAKAAAVAALEDVGSMYQYVDDVRTGRAQVAAALRRLGIETYPSEANFVLVKHPRSRELVEFLAARDIMVRDRSRLFGGVGHVRITIGGAGSTKRLVQALEAFFRPSTAGASVAEAAPTPDAR